MHILLIFTFDYSLEMWEKNKILERELNYFKFIDKNYEDIKLTILTYGDEGDLGLEGSLPNLKLIPAYSIIKYNKNKFIRYFKSFILPFKLKKVLKDVDVIKQFQLQGSWVSILLKYIIKKPLYIRTGYDMYRFSMYENKSLIKKKLYKYLTILALKHSDVYSVSSASDRNFLNNNFNLKKEISIIPNWVKQGKIKNFDQRFNNRVLAVGRLENQKNFHTLIEMFSNSDIEIDIVGDGSEINELKKVKEKFNSNVNFLGKLGFDELQDKYADYKIFVSTSNFEGNPKTILEAQANGCIVVSLSEENINELIENDIDGYICDKNNFLSMVELLLVDKNKTKFVSENAQKKVLKNNSLNLTISKELQLLNYFK